MTQQWSEFLSDGANKEELCEFFFSLWSDHLNHGGEIHIYMTHGPHCHLMSHSGVDIVEVLAHCEP